MTGDRGWLQVTNFVATGLLMLAGAALVPLRLASGHFAGTVSS